jgi:MFS family permease
VGPTHLAALLVGAAMYVQFLGAAQFVQADPAVAGYGFGASVLAASVVYLLPGSIAGVIAASLSGKLIGKFGAARVLIVSCVIGVAGFTLLVFAHDHAWQLICALIVVNIFVSASYAALPALLVERVSESDTVVVNAINAIARTFGSSVASAFVAAVLASITLAGTHIAAEQAYLVAFCVGGVAAGMAGLVAIWASCVSNDKI